MPRNGLNHWNFQFESRRRRTRTVKVRTALSFPCPAGQTDNGQSFFLKIRTEFWHPTESEQTESGQTDAGRNPDKNETRTVLSADVWLKDTMSHKLYVIKNCISNGFRFTIKFLWTSPSVSLSIHIFGTVQPVHNDMKPVLGFPKWKEVSRKKEAK